VTEPYASPADPAFRAVLDRGLNILSDGVTTLRQLGILYNLSVDTPETVRSLAKALYVRKPIITRAADRLETKGWVVRRADTSDRRSVHLYLTPLGAALCAALDGRATPDEYKALEKDYRRKLARRKAARAQSGAEAAA